MIDTRYLAGGLLVAGITLSAHSAAMTPAAGPAEAAQASVAAENASIDLTYVEFLVPAEQLPVLAAQKPDFAVLLGEAKSGKVGVVVSAFKAKDTMQSMSKAVSLVKYPTSHAMVTLIDAPTPSTPTTTTAGATPASPAKIPYFHPQDFEHTEVGLALTCTPSLQADGKTAELELQANRTNMDTAYGEHADGAGYPCLPIFSVNQAMLKVHVTNHVATHIATFQPAQQAKESRTRVVFIRADWGK